MMKIEHIALWVKDLEKMRLFYEKYFGAESGKKYVNPTTNFSSYFLTFGENETRIEIMQCPDIQENINENAAMGLAHFAVSVGSREKVNDLTKLFRNEGFKIANPPRATGDGYYESVICDPENNLIELTV